MKGVDQDELEWVHVYAELWTMEMWASSEWQAGKEDDKESKIFRWLGPLVECIDYSPVLLSMKSLRVKCPNLRCVRIPTADDSEADIEALRHAVPGIKIVASN